ncbi:NUDIX domain-containing protein [Pseudobacter ginsenosidimutans]|uniref:Bifunctional NMN adenylyltransferase/nudix hydrolase n=1 Tax=Pseudobacter ginsenosidimutans TaxID=661488 RepID=A0A4Q7MSA9_9BACT|nr:NUDIX domain-containing protein [Pseudobacter ginsenosidimutans]QEC41719.1 NUDIX domain-containing protein [Pseudobacter ginsenosidimutans]RZS71477.1 bifunctional NMN adenylyltransferase/nudix hydrolase [Pseudobacter ginsenosidimutans]
MKTTGVIVARFQTPYLHEGHKYLIDEIKSKHNKVVVVLGVSPVKGSRRNPFDFYTREKLLKQYAQELVVLPLSDNSSDTVWSQQLDKLLVSAFPMEMFMLYGSRGSFIPYYSGTLPVQALPEFGDHSATVIRDENADKVLDSADFRLGINYAYHTTYPQVYATVDIAVINEATREVLLGKKPNAAEWRFPGGFSDPEDESFEIAARRELSEECGDIEVQGMQYIGSARINDWRYKNETDKIISLFFKTKFIFGTPKASDDLAALSWFPLSELRTMKEQNKITPEHHVLIDLLLNK